ncbi:MAG TPA: peptidylprolyl isomerase [Kofleriaceae bacterium]|nr:peptidylprolyl isomerase [Kofleriaceae bacterium]
MAPPTRAELAAYTRDVPGTGALRAELHTNFGIIGCELFAEDAPLAVANFVGLARGLKAWRDPASGALARRRYYDGLTFHRVVRDFIVQGGDPLGDGTGGPGYVFADELSNGHSHDRPGVLAMANRNEPDTNGSQFYIMMKADPRLDARNTVFGQCDDLGVLGVINRLPVFDNKRPRTPVMIERVRIHREREL